MRARAEWSPLSAARFKAPSAKSASRAVNHTSWLLGFAGTRERAAARVAASALEFVERHSPQPAARWGLASASMPSVITMR
jgi:hypothetical protein